MFTNTKAKYYGDNKVLLDSACLSTDTKPTTGVANGSKCIEMDTGKTYMFNEEDSEWEELPSSGGGGGSPDYSTAEVTVTNNADSVIKPWDFPTLTEADTISCGAKLYPSVSKDFEVVMYKGTARCYVCDNSYNTIPSAYVTVTGAIEKITDIEGEDWYCLITGDGTISVP